MKQIKLILLTILFISVFKTSYAQDEKLSFEVNYNKPIGNNFIAENYDGIL